MLLDRWSPSQKLDWFSDLERMFDNVYPLLRANPSRARGFAPALEVAESENDYTVRVEVPGIPKKDVKVSLEGGVLTVEGEKREEERKETDTLHICEHRYGTFQRCVRLPDDVDVDKAAAQHSDGVLTITLPKKEEAKVKRREIAVK